MTHAKNFAASLLALSFAFQGAEAQTPDMRECRNDLGRDLEDFSMEITAQARRNASTPFEQITIEFKTAGAGLVCDTPGSNQLQIDLCLAVTSDIAREYQIRLDELRRLEQRNLDIKNGICRRMS